MISSCSSSVSSAPGILLACCLAVSSECFRVDAWGYRGIRLCSSQNSMTLQQSRPTRRAISSCLEDSLHDSSYSWTRVGLDLTHAQLRACTEAPDSCSQQRRKQLLIETARSRFGGHSSLHSIGSCLDHGFPTAVASSLKNATL